MIRVPVPMPIAALLMVFLFTLHPGTSHAQQEIRFWHGMGGALGMVSSVATVNSLIQTLVPDAIRGRVLSMHTMAFLGFTPLGSLLVGVLAERWDAPTALALSSGFALILTAVIALAARGVRKLQ